LRRWPEAGGLMSYGPDIYDLFHRSAIYVGKILCFFADCAVKKWPLRGSLRRPAR
jgi:hypothetical protein